MLRTLMTARQAMNLEQTRIDTLANNLANVATAGFRQVLTSVSERMPTPGGPGQAPPSIAGPDGIRRGDPMARSTGTTLSMSHKVDPRPGPLQSTGRATDLALSGRGFFVLKDTEGNEFFTRDGSFRLDETGKLVSPAGLEVQGESGAVNVAGGKFAIGTDGTVSVGGANRGRLTIKKFEQPELLEHRGDGLMRAGGDIEAVAVELGETTVMQGYIEGSNVDAVQTLVDMIAAQRAFEVESKVLQANDEMLGKSVNTLGRVT